MSSFPETRHDMVRASYRKTGDSQCKGCGAAIEWWKTTNGKSIPIDALKPGEDDGSRATAHWATCPNSRDFKGTNAAGAKPEKRSVLGPSAADDLRRLRERHQARVVVIVTEYGTTAVWANGIPGEDLRHDLISAGNFVRTQIAQQEDQR